MTRVLLVLALCLNAVLAIADPIDLKAPIPLLLLKDGRELRNVQIVSYATDTVMAKWERGRGTLPYSMLPQEIAEAAILMRPAPRPPAQPKPVVAAEHPPMVEQARQATVQYKGQAFVTKRRGGNFRIDDTEVMAVDPAEFKRFMRARDTSKLMVARATALTEYSADLAYAEKLKSDAINKALSESLSESPKALASTRTDGDGNYVLNCPDQEVILFACKLSKQGAGRDLYCCVWGVKVKGGGVINLTNANMMNPEED